MGSHEQVAKRLQDVRIALLVAPDIANFRVLYEDG